MHVALHISNICCCQCYQYICQCRNVQWLNKQQILSDTRWPATSGVLGGIRRIPTSGFFWQRILTSVIINKQGTFRPFVTPLCVYPPPFLGIHHCPQQYTGVDPKLEVSNKLTRFSDISKFSRQVITLVTRIFLSTQHVISSLKASAKHPVCCICIWLNPIWQWLWTTASTLASKTVQHPIFIHLIQTNSLKTPKVNHFS